MIWPLQQVQHKALNHLLSVPYFPEVEVRLVVLVGEMEPGRVVLTMRGADELISGDGKLILLKAAVEQRLLSKELKHLVQG
jgi:hypothetical protein